MHKPKYSLRTCQSFNQKNSTPSQTTKLCLNIPTHQQKTHNGQQGHPQHFSELNPSMNCAPDQKTQTKDIFM